MTGKELKSDIPALEGISDEPATEKDIRIPSTPQDPEAKSSFEVAERPEGYIYPTDAEYKSLLGLWIENKKPGTLTKGSRDFQVIKPDGYPVFVPLNVSLDAAYGSLSGGVSR